MRWCRQFATLLLATVLLWTALPATACLLAVHHPACCDGSMSSAGMMKPSGMRGTGTTASCCQPGSLDAAVTPVAPFSPEHSLQPLLVSWPPGLERPATATEGWPTAIEAPPPKSSAGRIAILRI